MQELIQLMPDPDVLTSLPTEELALRMLPLLVNRQTQSNNMLHCANLCGEFDNVARNKSPYAQAGAYSLQVIPAVLEAFVEAWSWL